MYANTEPPFPERVKLTCPAVRARKGAERLVMVTAYDFTMARLVDAAGVDMILVGDSLGMVIQGQPNTLPVSMNDMVYHTRCVQRGVAHALVVADMPFMSYQVSAEQAVAQAGRLVQEGGAEAVKLEGGAEYGEHIRRIVSAGIPVVGHVGLMPQSVHALGGFKMQGRGDDAGARILQDARAVQEAGAFCVVLESVPPDVAASVSADLRIPTIGIGAGASCDGQVLVGQDLLGMGRGRAPKFVKAYASLGAEAISAIEAFARDVRSGAFPGLEHTFRANRATSGESNF